MESLEVKVICFNQLIYFPFKFLTTVQSENTQTSVAFIEPKIIQVHGESHMQCLEIPVDLDTSRSVNPADRPRISRSRRFRRLRKRKGSGLVNAPGI